MFAYGAKPVSEVPFIWQQWVVLLCVPALALFAGFVWLGRHERTLRVATGQDSAGMPGSPAQPAG